jgi:ATP-dependent helicase/nuclease subunit A
MEWTGSQLEAVETRGRRIIVSAGAGSGKTRVLVERFLRLLEENPDWRVRDIVAVTFTEKAAREMVSRVRKEIRSRIEATASVEERRRWREHRNALDSSRIGTIHSLCASILRAHPAEAGIDPAFEVIDEVEAAALLNQSIEEAIEEAARLSPLQPEIEIFAHLSSRETSRALRALISQGESAQRAIGRVEGMNAEQIETFQRGQIEKARIETARSMIARDDWKRDVETVRTIRANDATDRREIVRAQVADLIEQLRDAGDDEIVRILLEVERAIDLRGGSKKKWPSEEHFQVVRDALESIRSSVRGEPVLKLETNRADRASAEVTWRLAGLYLRARRRFSAHKLRRGLLDFNDLEEMTERLLFGNEEVRRRLGDEGRIRALMVDEFQDTSPIQKRILWALAPTGQELFVIGDAKQSIYRFRGADVTVFHDARAEFNATGGREIGLATCFRAHVRLTSFVNHIFPSILTTESRHDTPYEAMSASRPVPHSDPSVEVHLMTQEKDAGEKLSAEDVRRAEARLIAGRIKEIERAGAIVCDERGGLRRAEFGDFALLFQASTYFEIYEQALADFGIPFVTTAGRGFYDRQEIVDLSRLLAFLASPIDDLSLAVALRSPMFAISDETLLSLRLDPVKDKHLWEALRDESVEIPALDKEAVAFARETLLRLKGASGGKSVADVIEAITRETGYLATLMMLPHGERRVANVEKFIEQARALAHLTLAEFVARIDDLKLREAREGEAGREEAGAVRIMTVHKAKGLEFPIVWIVDASYTGGGDRDIVAAHPEFGLAVNVRADAAECGDEDLKPAYFEMVKLIEYRMDRAEKKRLLYVAATRARDHLIVSGAVRGRLRGDDWLSRIATALEIDEQERPESISYAGGQVWVRWHDAATVLESEASDQPQCDVEDSAAPSHCDSLESASDAFPLIGPVKSS